MNASSAPARFWSIDCFRGLCALSVLGSHLVVWADFPAHGAIETALKSALQSGYDLFTWLFWPTGAQHPGVGGFFVLSGFCVHWQFAARAATTPDWKAYLTRRARRILPVYWAAALLGLTLVVAQRTWPVANEILDLHTSGGWTELAVRFGVANGVWPGEVWVGNMPLNTVGVETVIYLLYPAFFLLAVRGRWGLLGLIAVGLQGVALALEPMTNPFVLFTGALVMALLWYLGALAAHLCTRQVRVPGWSWLAAWAVFQGVGLLPRFYGQSLVKQAILGGAWMLLIVWLVRRERTQPVAQSRAVRLMRFTGDVSYSLYAVHTPTIMLVSWMLLRLRMPSYTLQLLGGAVATIVATLVLHFRVERRFYSPRGAPSAEARTQPTFAEVAAG